MLIAPTEIRDTSICNLPSKELVMKPCKQNGRDSSHVVYSAGDMKCFIKFNNATMNEAHSQLFFYNKMKERSNATIRIPPIYHAFGPEYGEARIAMEYIEIDSERRQSRS